MFHYKGKNVSIQTLASELSVQAIVSGRLLQRGDNLILSLELVDARTGNQIWGEQYNRRMTDIISLQSEVAREVSQKLRSRLTGAEENNVAKNHTQNTEAYQLYLQGRYHWNKRTVESVRKSQEYFRMAIEKDPTYALAYVGLADSFVVVNDRPPAEANPKAKAAALKALELDSSLGEAHAVLGNVAFYYEWDWPTAEREYKRAIELSPNYATAHHWYGESLIALGRFDEGFAQYNRALELDPLSLAIGTDYGFAFYLGRDYDKAIAHFQKLEELDPNYVRTQYYLADAFEEKQMFAQALDAHRKGFLLAGGDLTEISVAVKKVSSALSSSGPKGYWQATLDLTLEEAQDTTERLVEIASLYARLDQRDKAFEFLERTFRERAAAMAFLKVDPVWDNIRSDPRFTELQQRIGLPH